MALSRVSGTYALRLPDLLPLLWLLSPAPATEAIAKTTTIAVATPALRPPRPHNAFERCSPREPRPQSACERSPKLFARECRIYPFLSPSVTPARERREPQLHVKPPQRRSVKEPLPPPEGSGPA